MNNILENQRVLKRRKSSSLHTFSQNPAVYSFIQQVRQRPARTGRGYAHNSAPVFQFKNPLKGLFQFEVQPRKRREAAAPYRVERRRPRPGAGTEQRGAGFSFPIPSFATLALAAGTILLSILALNWDVPFLAPAHPVEPAPDMNEAGRRLAEFSLPYSGLLPAAQAPAPEGAVQPLAAAVRETPSAEGEDIPLDLIETFSWTNYQVKKGDSVSKIAADFSLSMDTIIDFNSIRNARRLRDGEMLRIPNMNGITYTVKKGDSLAKISASMEVPLTAILDANDIRSDDIKQGEKLFIPGAKMAPEALKLAMGELFVYPVRNRVTSKFGWRNDPFTGVRSYHAAVDLAGAIGTPVKAAMDGSVSVVSVNRVYGKFIILSHSGGYQTLYAHLSETQVKQGDYVNQGSKIGAVGNTGYSTGPHLHFGVYRNGRAVDPLELLY